MGAATVSSCVGAFVTEFVLANHFLGLGFRIEGPENGCKEQIAAFWRSSFCSLTSAIGKPVSRKPSRLSRCTRHEQ